MSQARLVVEETIEAPAAALWSAITDHEGMARWLPAKVSLLARREGGGVGTVRRIRASGVVAIDEEVVYADPPEGTRPGRLVYRIVRGAPLDFHRGEMLVEPISASRSRLRWDIVVASRVPGVARATIALLTPAIGAGVRKLGGLLA